MKRKTTGRVLLWMVLLAGTLFQWIGCTPKEEPLVGKWQRYGDAGEGTVIKVAPVGESYVGQIVSVGGDLADIGFQKQDMKWRNIKRVDEQYYQGEDLLKAVYESGEVAYTRYDSVYLRLINDDILQVSGFAKGAESVGTHQTWKKMR